MTDAIIDEIRNLQPLFVVCAAGTDEHGGPMVYRHLIARQAADRLGGQRLCFFYAGPDEPGFSLIDQVKPLDEEDYDVGYDGLTFTLVNRTLPYESIDYIYGRGKKTYRVNRHEGSPLYGPYTNVENYDIYTYVSEVPEASIAVLPAKLNVRRVINIALWHDRQLKDKEPDKAAGLADLRVTIEHLLDVNRNADSARFSVPDVIAESDMEQIEQLRTWVYRYDRQREFGELHPHDVEDLALEAADVVGPFLDSIGNLRDILRAYYRRRRS